MILKIFLPLLTIFVLCASTVALAQHSCSDLFTSKNSARLSSIDIHTTKDLQEIFLKKDVIDEIKSRDPFTEHNPELIISVDGVLEQLAQKLAQVNGMKELENHKGLGFLESKIEHQIRFVRRLIKDKKLSYANYYYNMLVLMGSLDGLLWLENSITHPKLEFNKYIRDQDIKEGNSLVQARNSIRGVSQRFRNKLNPQDVTGLSRQQIDSLLENYELIVVSAVEGLRMFLESDSLLIFTFKPISEADLIGLDLSRLFFIESTDSKQNPHKGYWFSLSHGLHDIFHLRDIISSNKLMESEGLTEYWIAAREKIKVYINRIQDAALREAMMHEVYNATFERPTVRRHIAKFYKSYLSGTVDTYALQMILHRHSEIKYILMDALSLQPDGNPRVIAP